MIGAVIGDIIGSRFEFYNNRSKEFTLFTTRCFPTDDSIMTLALAKAIMETAKVHPPSDSGYSDAFFTLLSDMSVKWMQKIGRKYPRCGYGGGFKRWMFSENPIPYNSYGNGAAMRVSPAGFAARSLEEAERLAETITAVTHNHPEGIKGAKATAAAIWLARSGSSMQEIRQHIVSNFYKLDFTIDEIRPTYRFDVSCQGTVPQAIESFLESTSFEDAIRVAISLGGDSDTMAAITGAIAEAYYDIPPALKAEALSYLDPDLLTIYEDWHQFAPPIKL